MEPQKRLLGLRFLVFCLLAARGATAFILSVKPSKHSILRDTWEGATNGSGGRIEQLEYKIYADGKAAPQQSPGRRTWLSHTVLAFRILSTSLPVRGWGL